jgi:diguanylate cyclase (GGDEF)-like protein
MTVQGETLGVLHLQARQNQSIEQIEQLAVTVAVRVGLAVANLKLRESLRLQSIRDPLTGLFNRRYMEETLERELHRAARHQLPLGVVMLDIDHFKQYNDTFGHGAGDDLLRELGTFLQANVRSEDVPCRYGGEEFIIIFPEATLEDTCKRAEQMHEGINRLKTQSPDKPLGSITVSQGVASFPEHGASAGQILRSVDAALYRAKRSGRDKIIVAET